MTSLGTTCTWGPISSLSQDSHSLQMPHGLSAFSTLVLLSGFTWLPGAGEDAPEQMLLGYLVKQNLLYSTVIVLKKE
jgi:hypothetical protein